MLNSTKKSDITLTHLENYSQRTLIRPISSITSKRYSPTDAKGTNSPFKTSNSEKRLLMSRKNLVAIQCLKQSNPSFGRPQTSKLQSKEKFLNMSIGSTAK